MLCKQRVQNCSITSHQLSSHTTDRMCIQLINSFMHCLPRMLGIVQAAQHRKSLSNKCWINGSEMKYSIRNIPSCLLLRNKWISNMLSTASQSAIHYENACGMRGGNCEYVSCKWNIYSSTCRLITLKCIWKIITFFTSQSALHQLSQWCSNAGEEDVMITREICAFNHCQSECNFLFPIAEI